MKATLLITTFDRAALLRQSLERLKRLTPPGELIVVDDGGTDDTESVVAEFGQAVEFPVRYVYTHNPGKTICSHARNVGVKAATHDWIVTSEPELCWRSDLLPEFAQLASRYPGKVISVGHIYFSPLSEVSPDDCDPPPGCDQAVGWVAPHCALYKKEWLIEVGGWDESFPGNWGWDDTDLLTRLRLAGHHQHIATELEAVHLWHVLGGDENHMNEAHFMAKRLQSAEGIAENTIANRGVEWGQVKPR